VQAKYLLSRGLHFANRLDGSNNSLVIYATEGCNLYYLSTERIGEYEHKRELKYW
jgi:hypothetical protein